MSEQEARKQGMKWDQDAPWAKPVGAVMSSTAATQHGGQEMTQFSGIANLLHFGMIIVGLPYGASTITGSKGQRQPSE